MSSHYNDRSRSDERVQIRRGGHQHSNGINGRSDRGGRGDGPGNCYRGRGGGESGFRGRGGRGGGGGRGGPAPISDYPSGGRFKVATNQFRITPIRPQLIFHKHLVEIDNPSDPARVPKSDMKYKILNEFLCTHGKRELLYAYDGDRVLYSFEKLHLTSQVLEFGRASYSCSVTYQTALDLRAAHLDVRSSSEACTMLDIILQSVALCSQEKQGRIKFVPRAPNASQMVPLPGCPGKSIWRGHSQTVQPSRIVTITVPTTAWGDSNPYQIGSNIEIGCQISPASVIGIQRQPLSDYLSSIFNYAVLGTNKRPPDRRIAKSLKGLKCETFYIPSQTTNQPEKRVYKIESLDFNKTARTFEFEYEGRVVTLQQYFQLRYNIALQSSDAPLVHVAPRSKSNFLPAELVFISQQKMPGVYTEAQKSSLADSMCINPADRAVYIQNKILEVFGDRGTLEEFGLQIDSKMIHWDAEVLQAPELEYRDAKKNNIISFRTINEKGAWNMKDKSFLVGQTLNRVRVVNTTGTQLALDAFNEAMRTQIRNVGMRGSFMVKTDQVAISELENFRRAIEKGKEKEKEKPEADMIFVLLASKEVAPYRAVKIAFDGYCPTQCLVVGNTPNLNDRPGGAGHFCNILAKVNQKLGVNHRIRREWGLNTLRELGIDDKRRNGFMVVGVNMSNPQVGTLNLGKYLPSVCSLVASANADCTGWVHSLRVQKRGNELIEDMEEMMSDVLRKRSQILKLSEWPDRIVFIRDGVSEGKMEDVCCHEVAAIKAVFTKGGHPDPDVTAFVAVKNHNTRFWDPKTQDVRSNLCPGTWIAESGVHPLKFPNFYLLSHAGIKGMSRPVRYFILQDDVGMRPELKNKLGKNLLSFWSSFLYQQCYLYQRCQRAVRVPAPIYYADQLAQRGRLVVSPIIQRELGLDMLGESDTASIASSARPTAEITGNDEALRIANYYMKKFTDEILPMFYC